MDWIRTALRRHQISPRRWLIGLFGYARYLGYVRPQLLQGSEAEYRVRRQMLAQGWEPRKLVPPLGKCILALCPHPDDESIGAGGFLLAHKDLAEIHLICLCNGDAGGSLGGEDASTKSMKKVRRKEFHKTADDLRAHSVTHLDFPDGHISIDVSAIAALRSAVLAVKPDVVVLPWFLDGHIDHRSANLLYARACFDLDVIVLGYEIWSLLEPNAVLDITDLLQSKLRLIANYPSQLSTVDYVQYASALAHVRAYQAAITPLRSGAAEAFLALPNREYCELVTRLTDQQKQSEGAVKPFRTTVVGAVA
jgi:LmbE family N-acetylglucosaminyl deacetylase